MPCIWHKNNITEAKNKIQKMEIYKKDEVSAPSFLFVGESMLTVGFRNPKSEIISPTFLRQR